MAHTSKSAQEMLARSASREKKECSLQNPPPSGGNSKLAAVDSKLAAVDPKLPVSRPAGTRAPSPKKQPAIPAAPLMVPGVQEVPRGRNAPPHLATGQVLNGKYRIDKLIGSGGFGQIYQATDELNRHSVAIKVVPAVHEPGRMILEQKVLILLRGSAHAPHLIASGQYGGLMYIIMEMLGRNLSDVKKHRKLRRLTVGTVMRVGQQVIAGLKSVHDVGYLHRDVKPSNMCIGLDGIHRRTVYLVDFGMTRQYRTASGTIRKERAYANFRGTMRYVSITVHDRKEQGPVDDMWSLLYSLIELAEGSLPWKHLSDPEDIAAKKRATLFEEMCRHLPRSVKDFQRYLEKLTYYQQPDYDLLSDILKTALPSDVSNETPFDWENSASLMKSVTKSNDTSS